MVTAVEIISLVATIVSYFGAAMIVYGSICAVYSIIRVELHRNDGLNYQHVRGQFAHRIIFALDFLIASDILRTVTSSLELENIAALGGVVAIRAALTFILSRETKGIGL